MMKNVLKILFTSVIFAMVLAACGGSDGGDGTSSDGGGDTIHIGVNLGNRGARRSLSGNDGRRRGICVPGQCGLRSIAP